MAEPILNTEIGTLNTDSQLYKLYIQLYNGMVDANKVDFPDMSKYTDDTNNINTDGTLKDTVVASIQKDINSYSDTLMKNSAYNTAKSIINIVGEEAASKIVIYTYTRTSVNITDDMAIQNALNGAKPTNGCMTIVIDTSSDGKTEYGRTGFVYDGSAWKAFNGHVDAKNVILRDDIILSGDYVTVGNINKGTTDATVTLKTNGISVIDAFNKILSKVIEPKVTLPSISSFIIKANTDDGITDVEEGTICYQYWKIIFSVGSYSYNDTGVTVKSYAVTDENKTQIGIKAEGISTNQVQVTSAGITLTASVSYSDGVTPQTNMKENSTVTEGIKAGTATATATITSYRQLFYGYSTSVSVDSSVIRGLTGVKSDAMTITLDENTTASKIIVAIPKDTKSLTDVIMPSSSNLEITSEFIKQTAAVKVAGANDYNPIDYDVWIYEPAKMAGTYTITIA